MIKHRGLIVHPYEVVPAWQSQLIGSSIDVLGIHPVGGDGSHLRVKELMQNGFDAQKTQIIKELSSHGIKLEYEMHAMSMLLPREHFDAHPEWFRMDENGVRTPDYNCCASNADALDVISDTAAELAVRLPSGTHRYNLWLDDVRDKPCHCKECKKLTPSDQAMKIYNAVVKGLRRTDPLATQSYLAYCNATELPKVITPEDGIVLEYAPFDRDFTKPLTDENNAKSRQAAAELIKYYGTCGSKALDYWLDNSLYSGWTKPPKPFKLRNDVLDADLEFYDKIGYETVTTFACYLGDDYRELYGTPEIEEYLKRK